MIYDDFSSLLEERRIKPNKICPPFHFLSPSYPIIISNSMRIT